MKKHVKELGPLLIELTLCTNYEIRLANRDLLQRIFEDMSSKVRIH